MNTTYLTFLLPGICSDAVFLMLHHGKMIYFMCLLFTLSLVFHKIIQAVKAVWLRY